MEASKITLTKETKEKMSKGLTKNEKGKLRDKRLHELAESGKLQFIKTRRELAEAIGFPHTQSQNAGYQWVLYNIRKGKLIENIAGYTDYGTAEYEYRLPEENKIVSKGIEEAIKEFPNLIKKVEEPTEEEKRIAEVRAEAIHQAMSEQYDRQQAEAAKPASTIITIYRGDTTVALENVDADTIMAIIKAVMGQV